MRKIKRIIIGIVVVAGLLFPAELVGAVNCPVGTERAGQDVSTASLCNAPQVDADNNSSVWPTIQNIINFLIGLAAIITVFVIIIAGIQIATSQGDSTKVAKAKNAIIFSLVGLIIAIVAFAIVNFVLSNVFT